MGLRNPFRIEFNKASGSSTSPTTRRTPDAPNPLRGPAGQGKWTVVTRARQLRLAVLRDRPLPYVDYNFATGISGAAFNCAAPVNESPNNTGVRTCRR